jgi:hypothetical protein
MRWDGIFLTVKDLMHLTGNKNYSASRNYHQQIRDSIGQNKRKLTIYEYCNYEGVGFAEIWTILRVGQAIPPTPQNNA